LFTLSVNAHKGSSGVRKLLFRANSVDEKTQWVSEFIALGVTMERLPDSPRRSWGGLCSLRCCISHSDDVVDANVPPPSSKCTAKMDQKEDAEEKANQGSPLTVIGNSRHSNSSARTKTPLDLMMMMSNKNFNNRLSTSANPLNCVPSVQTFYNYYNTFHTPKLACNVHDKSTQTMLNLLPSYHNLNYNNSDSDDLFHINKTMEHQPLEQRERLLTTEIPFDALFRNNASYWDALQPDFDQYLSYHPSPQSSPSPH
jgi:hypothetical protein